MSLIEPLFKSGSRTDSTPKGHLEEEYAFLGRVQSRFFAEVRRALNEWFAHYPGEEREELRVRLLSGDERESYAAFWELLLHELYTRAGFRVSVHPELEGTKKRPDFLLERDGNRVLLEARFATGESEEKWKRDRRRRALYRAIDRARPENFKVKLDIKRDGKQQPPVRAIVKQLEHWLAELSPDVVAAALQQQASFQVAPMLPVTISGWELEFRALPLKSERRGEVVGPTLGVLPTETYVGDPKTTVRAALKAKGSRYGTPPYPLVVALAIEEPWLHDEDVHSALYGQTVTYISPGDQPFGYAEGRLDDGYWSGQRNAGRRVSAVVTMHHVRPWFAVRQQPHLWLNPWAEKPYTAERLWAWTAADSQSGAFTGGPASTSSAELLGLPPGWPPGEAFGRGDSDP